MRTKAEYLVLRLGSFVLQFTGAMFFVYWLVNLLPYDPVAIFIWNQRPTGQEEINKLITDLHHRWGIDQPVYVQFYHFMYNLVVHQSLGMSWMSMNIDAVVRFRLPRTIFVLLASIVLYIPLSTFLGLYAARHQHTLRDDSLNLLSSVLYGIPYYVYAILFIFATQIPKFTDFDITPVQKIILYCATIGIIVVVFTAFHFRIVRSQILDVMNQNYIRTARAKGLNERRILFRHALKNKLPEIIISYSNTIPIVISAIIIIEILFSMPGLGPIMAFTVIQIDWGMLIGLSAIFLIINGLLTAFTDFAAFAVDPLETKSKLG